ncbi:MAG: ThiF family adenylyltransferase [Magnetococcus sp. WYHC-3]
MPEKKMKICVVGCGALGSHLVLMGRNLKVEFTVIDDDRVEQKNIASQFHTKMGLSKNKTQALQQAMNGLFGLAIKTVPHRLTSNNVDSLLSGADVVVDCVDNGESRRVIQNYVRSKGIPCLHGALAADGQFGSVIWDELFKIDDENVRGQATCDGGEFLPFIVDVSSALVRCLQDYLEKDKKINMHLWPYKKMIL